MDTVTGECLCGQLQYRCEAQAIMAGHCQCTDCQKMSGSGHASSIAFPAGSLKITGEMSTYQKKADSGNIVTRGFCPNCGSQVHATNTGYEQFEFIRAGSLHNLEHFKPTMVVYAKSAASWDSTDPELVHFDEMPSA